MTDDVVDSVPVEHPGFLWRLTGQVIAAAVLIAAVMVAVGVLLRLADWMIP